MLHFDTELRLINPEMGYGVFATRRIPKGTIVWTRCELDQKLQFPAESLANYPPHYQNILHKYGYIDPWGTLWLCWDLAKFCNHSCESNCLELTENVDIAVRDIEAGEQLTCEYGLHNRQADIICKCESKNCRQIVKKTDPLHYSALWQKRIEEAQPFLKKVHQPLYGFILDTTEFDSIADGKKSIDNHEYFYFKPEMSEG